MTARAPRLCLALAAATLSPAAWACAGQTTQRAEGNPAACAKTSYQLTVHPTMIVSNERHSIAVRALADACGHQTAVRGAAVRLHGYRATTGSGGRCTLAVTLPTGHYLVRLYVHGRRVAHAPVSAIPVVAH